jgi:4-hydroxy-tetrahydrodipicolinate synthase
MITKFKGTGVALITPFRNSGTIDYTALKKIVDNVIESGVDFVLALGTTSESVTLNATEKSAVVESIIEFTDNRVPVMIGIGGNNTQEVCSKLRNSDLDGISGILSVAPYYNKPQQSGIYEHFKAIASETDKEIILYNVPGRTSSNISAETCLQLAHDFDNITAVKEASGDLNQIMQIIKNKEGDFTVLSGDDALTLPILSIGAEGVVSVIANAYPETMSAMVKSVLKEKNYKKALKMHYSLLDSMNAIFKDGNPSGIKALLSHQGLISNEVRLPLVKVNRSLNLEIKNLMESNKLK